MAIKCGDHKRVMKTMSGENSQLLMFNCVGTHSNHHTLKDYMIGLYTGNWIPCP